MKRQRAERRGRRAETIAVWWLRLQGWRILARRMRTPRGEIDIVARRGQVLIFVEVKARDSDEALSLAIDQWRLLRVAAAAEALIRRFGRADDDIRIDVILIAPRRLPVHLKNVWHG